MSSTPRRTTIAPWPLPLTNSHLYLFRCTRRNGDRREHAGGGRQWNSVQPDHHHGTSSSLQARVAKERSRAKNPRAFLFCSMESAMLERSRSAGPHKGIAGYHLDRHPQATFRTALRLGRRNGNPAAEPCSAHQAERSSGSAIQQHRAIGILYGVREENVAFLEFSRHFRRHAPAGRRKSTPQDLDHGAYLEEDLGDTTLFEFLSQNRSGENIAPPVSRSLSQSRRLSAALSSRSRPRSELRCLLPSRRL